MQVEPLSIIPRSENPHGISAHLRSRWDLRQKPAIRTAEPKLAVRLSIELVAVLMNGAVMPATEKSEIRERCGTSLCPVADVMSMAETNPAPREAAAAVSMMERPP